jgi:hypothetical protein
MKFLCLICAEKTMEQMSAADAERHYRECTGFIEAIRHSRPLSRLQPSAAPVGGYHGPCAQRPDPH